MEPRNKNSTVFFPNLNALRFFCFISIFFVHSFATKYSSISSDPTYHFIKRGIFGNGSLGVNFFFVLSGFLITYLLIVEKEKFSRIDIKKFYIRRILRIWPLFYFCVFFGFIIFPFLKHSLGGDASSETATPKYFLFFLNNFEHIKKGTPDSSVLGVLWSVAIEEQFYFFWPLLVGFTKRKHLPYLFLGIITASFVFRFINANNAVVLEIHTFSCISDLTIGGLGAYLVFYSTSFKKNIELLRPSIIALIYIASLSVFFFRGELFSYNPILLSLDRLIISVLFLFIILEQNFSKRSLFKLKALKKISILGQYTYGLYCLHMIGILIVATLLTKLGMNKSLWQVLLLEGGLSLALAIGIAYLSYHFYEKRFLSLKEKFAVVKTTNKTQAIGKPEQNELALQELTLIKPLKAAVERADTENSS